MKQTGNIIDISDYYIRKSHTEAPAEAPVISKVLHYMGRSLEIAATTAIALCICVCTLLFFTML